jgi:hypothetical protein
VGFGPGRGGMVKSGSCVGLPFDANGVRMNWPVPVG